MSSLRPDHRIGRIRDLDADSTQEMTHEEFGPDSCLVGRPNTGKSTLTNALVGAKVAITSNRPQTTRHTIRGIVHRDEFQIVLVDTPACTAPEPAGQTAQRSGARHLQRGRRNRAVHPGRRGHRPGDRWIYEQIRDVAPRTTLLVIVTKIDKVAKERVAAQLMAVHQEFGEHATEIVPVSATTGEQIDVLVGVLADQLPPGPAFYPDGELTDEPEEVLMAELIREAALEGVRDELPHSLAVVIEESGLRDGRDDLMDVHAILYVERDSQKGIVIGKGGPV